MAIKNGKPNPLNFLDLRRVEFPARHFHFTTLEKYNPTLIKKIDDWIYTNLNGRYYVGQGIALDRITLLSMLQKLGLNKKKRSVSFYFLIQICNP